MLLIRPNSPIRTFAGRRNEKSRCCAGGSFRLSLDTTSCPLDAHLVSCMVPPTNFRIANVVRTRCRYRNGWCRRRPGLLLAPLGCALSSRRARMFGVSDPSSSALLSHLRRVSINVVSTFLRPALSCVASLRRARSRVDEPWPVWRHRCLGLLWSYLALTVRRANADVFKLAISVRRVDRSAVH